MQFSEHAAELISQAGLDWSATRLLSAMGLLVVPGLVLGFLFPFLMNAPITAGITMFPLLVQDGAVIDSEFEQTAVQKTRGTKGAIGVDGTYIYLAIVTGATVTESAYVLQALGARDALNLDGGGTAAMFIGGSYTVGPGRLLPNAIVLTKP